MKITSDAIIPEEKLTHYLLVTKPQDDKSKFLAHAGFTQDNPADLLKQLKMEITNTEYFIALRVNCKDQWT